MGTVCNSVKRRHTLREKLEITHKQPLSSLAALPVQPKIAKVQTRLLKEEENRKVIVKQSSFKVLEGEYSGMTLFKTLFEEALNNLPLNMQNSAFSFKFKGREISVFKEYEISLLLHSNKENFIEMVYNGVNLAALPRESFYKSTFLVGKPVLDSNPLKITVFDKKDLCLNSFAITKVGEHLQEQLSFDFFRAYCNGNNYMFVSGGETVLVNGTETKNQLYSDKVWSINLETHSYSQVCKMSEPRGWHSMLYLPTNLLAVVGGIGSSTCEIVNLRYNTTSVLPEMKESRSEASLALVNDRFLFAFCGLDKDKKHLESVEYLNLRDLTGEWQFLKFNSANLSLKKNFFAISYCGNVLTNELLLVGGVSSGEESRVDYKLKFENEKLIELNQREECTFQEDLFLEKFCVPLDHRHSVSLPVNRYRGFLIVEKERIKFQNELEDIEMSPIMKVRSKIRGKTKMILRNHDSNNNIAVEPNFREPFEFKEKEEEKAFDTEEDLVAKSMRGSDKCSFHEDNESFVNSLINS